MNKSALLYILVTVAMTVAAPAAQEAVVIASYGNETSSAHLEAVRMDGKPGAAVVFTGTADLHYCATSQAAPVPGMEFRAEAMSENAAFGRAVYPAYSYFDDPAKGKIEVWAGNFTIFFPLQESQALVSTEVTVTIRAMACTSQVCMAPFVKTLSGVLDFSNPEALKTIEFEQAKPAGNTEPSASASLGGTGPLPQESFYTSEALAQRLKGWRQSGQGEAKAAAGTGWYLLLSVLAGVSINIMPCVLPVLPLIVLRLVGQSKESKPRRVGLGLAFCAGIVLFFAMFAVVSAGVKIATGTALDLNSLYRSPAAVTAMFLLIVLFALVLLDIVQVSLPGFAAGRSGGSGFMGSAGMGFLAGVLSTPCSGAVIGAVLVWAQTQTVWVSGLALVLMGVGMALPYAALVSAPKLLALVPRPGTWMEVFKKTGGFLLLAIAVKFMLTGLEKEHLINVLLYGVIFAFCVWMWGTWVSFNTPAAQRRLVRGIAAAIAIAAGVWMLPGPREATIDWQAYDAGMIEQAIRDGRPVLVKFTADWCTNCKVVDKRIYQQPEIAKLLAERGFVTIKADTTQADYAAAIDMHRVFGEPGNVPVTVLLNPRDRSITKLRGIFTAEQLVNYLGLGN
ncbi:MAG: thioredoxin family protein [Planctomycetaceae bacterium]|nr:thioredoxin family protein [Planctomycetaceae bacterium]